MAFGVIGRINQQLGILLTVPFTGNPPNLEHIPSPLSPSHTHTHVHACTCKPITCMFIVDFCSQGLFPSVVLHNFLKSLNYRLAMGLGYTHSQHFTMVCTAYTKENLGRAWPGSIIISYRCLYGITGNENIISFFCDSHTYGVIFHAFRRILQPSSPAARNAARALNN